jgi:hypothetical protein
MRLRIPLIVGLVASLAMIVQAPANAGKRDAAIAGAVMSAMVGGVIASQTRQVHHYAPPPVYHPSRGLPPTGPGLLQGQAAQAPALAQTATPPHQL